MGQLLVKMLTRVARFESEKRSVQPYLALKQKMKKDIQTVARPKNRGCCYIRWGWMLSLEKTRSCIIVGMRPKHFGECGK